MLIPVVLAGCAISKTDPIRPEEITSVSDRDIKQLYGETEPLSHPLTLDEAIARALKYNLDTRVKVMEQALAQDQWDIGRYDLLPKVVADAGYTNRNNDLITRSVDSVTGEPSLAHPYISSSRDVWQQDLGFSWSVLDFGQSYYTGRMNSDRALVAEEHRRKAEYQLIADVRTSFWRVASAQKLQARVNATIADARAALELSEKVENSRLSNPLDQLRYQRQLLENLRLLEAVNQELSSARIDLALLTRLPLDRDFTVTEPSADITTWWRDVPVDKLEEQAIARNPNLRESFYNVRIATSEARRDLLKMFPGLSFNYGFHHSNDDYLINNAWYGAGLQLSVNLVQGLLTLPAQKRMGDAGIELARQQRLATTMSVLAQVHIARLNLDNAWLQYQRADSIWRVDRDIAVQVANRATAQVQSPLDGIANQTSAILSELRRYQAMALVQASASRLQATLGVNPDVGGQKDMTVSQLTQRVSVSLARWEKGDVFDAVPAAAATADPASTAGAPRADATSGTGADGAANRETVASVAAITSK
jgi:outer membrane protein TolC